MESETDLYKQASSALVERGLLDISVELSTRDITAGNQFALFVLVKNPFDKPVWIRRVHVSLPSELKLAIPEEVLEQAREKEKEKEKKERNLDRENQKNLNNLKLQERRIQLEAKLINLEENLAEFTQQILKTNDLVESESLIRIIEKIKKLIVNVQDELKIVDEINTSSEEKNVVNFSLHGSRLSFGDLKIASDLTNLSIGDKDSEVAMGDLEIVYSNPLLKNRFSEENVQTRTIELESSLPFNVGLQPGGTVVYTALLYVKSSIIFTPSRYRLQFNVNYSFSPKAPSLHSDTDRKEIREEVLFTNTVAHELSIRPSVYSVLLGSGIGGFTGSVARLLQITPTDKWQAFSSVDAFTSCTAVVLAVILSGIAVVFMARKSESQSFVSIEDFWGGLLIGFLVGYTGTSFFEQLTGVSPIGAELAPEVSPTP